MRGCASAYVSASWKALPNIESAARSKGTSLAPSALTSTEPAVSRSRTSECLSNEGDCGHDRPRALEHHERRELDQVRRVASQCGADTVQHRVRVSVCTQDASDIQQEGN